MGGALANFALLGDRAFTNLGQEPTGPYPRAFDAHVVSYTNITTKRILVEKQAYWLICQGQEKIEERCKGMFSILCMHFFIAYQARITERNWELWT